MVKCCAPHCDNASYRKSEEISFHRFPKDENLKKKWLLQINRKGWQPNASSMLCSKHFAANMIERSEFRTILTPGAIPTIFNENLVLTVEDKCVMPQSHSVAYKRSSAGEVILSEKCNPMPPTEPSTSTAFTPYESPHDASPNKENVPDPQSVTRKRTATASEINSAGQESQQENEKGDHSETRIIFGQMHGRSTFTPTSTIPPLPLAVSGSHNQHTKDLEKLKNKLITKNKKIKCLQERNRRFKNKVRQMSDVLADLKNKLNGEELATLGNIPVNNKDFMVRYLKKAKSCTLEKSYSPEVRAFALQLHFFSTRAYNHVRNYFNTVLPHPVTISRWYKKIDAQPGFTSESFDTLKSISENTKYKIFANLSIDEMAIRKEQVWDRESSKFIGHVDTGTGVSDDSLPLATQALVLMLTAINACWKLPVAYFYISSMTGEQRANIVKMAIQMLYDINIFVVGLTFDGAASNISMARVLGCNFSFESFAPHFFYEDLKIYAFYDPCHMLKLIRNCFGDFKILVDKDGNHINFEYLSILESLAQTKGLHLAVKLRKAHINFTKQKMKVRLAAQLFSKSVADALSFCKDILQLEQFKECEATINFITIINDCFDVLNSRTPLAPGTKKALCAGNIERVKEFVNKASDYLSNLKFLNQKLIIQSARKTGFVGFIICLHNVINLYEDLLNKGGIKYLCTYKISQDHLEMFFGKIRSRGGFNDNPNVVQFKTAYKKNVIITELQLREKGILNDATNILNVTSAKNIDQINNSTPSCDKNDNVSLTSVNESHLYSFLQNIINSPLDEYSQHIITYIAGFITRRMLAKIKCTICQNLLTGEREDFMLSLINVKDRGGLTYPSKEIVNIVKKCEMFLKINYKKKSFPAFIANFVSDESNVNILRGASSHSVDHDDKHLHELLITIVKIFFNIRCYHIAKTDQISERNYLKKIVLFKNK